MKVRCISNTGKALREFEGKVLDEKAFGRFGASAVSVYGEIGVDREYIVMGIVVFETYQAYLVDDNGFISTCPCQLFEVIDPSIRADWQFRLIGKDEHIYPFVQSVFGYPELCDDHNAYENLIVEKEESAIRTYFKRKVALEIGKN